MTTISLTRPDALPPKIRSLRARLFSLFEPPVSLRLSEWAESCIKLPSDQNARPDSRDFKMWPPLVEPLDSIGDDQCERVTMVKPARLGFTKLLAIAIAARAARRPRSIGLLVPIADQARDFVVDELEPLFAASPALQGLLPKNAKKGSNTLTHKRFARGGRLRVIPARSPRRMRSHDFQDLFCDEIDGMELTTEGDPLAIAEKRTFAHADRKIVFGSTPTEEDASPIDHAYAESDQRIYEVPCPHCDERFELCRDTIRWPDGEPEKAACFCPSCGGEIAESVKPQLLAAGRWRPRRPEVTNHRGYRLSTWVSLLPNAAWPKLAAEWEKAKRAGPGEMQVFVNLVDGRPWKTTIGRVSAETLAGRVEPIGLDRIPAEVVQLTAGVDTQDARLEVTVLGWPLVGAPCVLAHLVIDGSTALDETWSELDKFLRERWTHPNGWEMRIDATAVDSGGHRTQKVYDFCSARLHRRIYAIKGASGPRPIWKRAEKVKRTSHLWILGHDQLKKSAMELLAEEPLNAEGRPNPNALRVSDSLDPEWFEQVTNEVQRIRYVRNRAVITYEPKEPNKKVEALDCFCYAIAVRRAPALRAIDLRARAARRPTPNLAEGQPVPPETQRPRSRMADWAQRFNG